MTEEESKNSGDYIAEIDGDDFDVRLRNIFFNLSSLIVVHCLPYNKIMLQS